MNELPKVQSNPYTPGSTEAREWEEGFNDGRNQTVILPSARDRDFSTSWFDRDTRPLWQKYILPLAPFNAYCETGTHEAASLLWAFDNLLSSRGTAVGIDSYLPKRAKNIEEVKEIRERCHRNIAAAVMTGRLILKERPSKEVLLEWCAEGTGGPRFDCFYVDAEHWAPGALLDIVLAWELLLPGGVLVVDDVHRQIHRAKPLVRQAVEAFEHCYETKYRELYRAPRQRAYVKERN